jgi:transposase-like protein
VSNWLTALVTLASILLGGGGLAVIVNAITGRRPRKAEVADRLSESTLKWVEQFQEETASARREATDARREVAEMRRELAQLRDDAEKLGRELRSIRSLILSPAATLEQLRAAVAGPGQANGR